MNAPPGPALRCSEWHEGRMPVFNPPLFRLFNQLHRERDGAACAAQHRQQGHQLEPNWARAQKKARAGSPHGSNAHTPLTRPRCIACIVRSQDVQAGARQGRHCCPAVRVWPQPAAHHPSLVWPMQLAHGVADTRQRPGVRRRGSREGRELLPHRMQLLPHHLPHHLRHNIAQVIHAATSTREAGARD